MSAIHWGALKRRRSPIQTRICTQLARSAPAEAPSVLVEIPTSRPAPLSPLAKIDPEVMKRYRVDVCYYETFVLLQAREDYLAKLGKSRPGKGHIPGFAAAGTTSPGNGQAQAPTPPRVPYERSARACTMAVSLVDPSFGDVDTAVAAYAPLAVQLGKDFAAASEYYQKGEYTRDNFALGGELHARLIAGFPKLDKLHEDLGVALASFRTAHFKGPATMEQGEWLARAAIEDAREIVATVTAGKLDPKALSDGIDKLGKSIGVLSAYSAATPRDAWSRILTPPLEAFLRTAAGTTRSATQRAESESFHAVVNGFTRLIEAWQRAASRASIAKNGPPPSGVDGGTP